jgi:hypothetical protein
MVRSIQAALFLAYCGSAIAGDAGDLHRAIAAACQCSIISVSVGDPANRATWKVQYDPSTTAGQQATGNAVLASFNMQAPGVPQTVSSMGAKVALERAGLLTAVQNWVNTQNAETQLIWNTAANFNRNSNLISNGAAALGLTSAQLDALFITAATINP